MKTPLNVLVEASHYYPQRKSWLSSFYFLFTNLKSGTLLVNGFTPSPNKTYKNTSPSKKHHIIILHI